MIELTIDQIREIDTHMLDHMYHHSISNSYNASICNTLCRQNELLRITNKVLKEVLKEEA